MEYIKNNKKLKILSTVISLIIIAFCFYYLCNFVMSLVAVCVLFGYIGLTSILLNILLPIIILSIIIGLLIIYLVCLYS